MTSSGKAIKGWLQLVRPPNLLTVPGDPLAGEKALTEKIRENLEVKYGLDQPVMVQYGIFLENLVQGDLGISLTQENRRVNDIIAEHFPVSATLGVLAIYFAAIGVPGYPNPD